MNAFRLGMISGIVFGTIVVVISVRIKKREGNGDSYDERQELIRGKGYRLAFFALMILNCLYAMLLMVFTTLPIEPSLALISIVLIAGMMMLVYNVWNDAYFGVEEKDKKHMFALAGVMAITQMTMTISRLSDHRVVVDGVVTLEGGIPIVLAVFFFVMFFTLYLKDARNKKEAGE